MMNEHSIILFNDLILLKSLNFKDLKRSKGSALNNNNINI